MISSMIGLLLRSQVVIRALTDNQILALDSDIRVTEGLQTKCLCQCCSRMYSEIKHVYTMTKIQ